MGAITADTGAFVQGWQGWLLGACLVLLAMAVAYGVRIAGRHHLLGLSLKAANSQLCALKQHDALTGLVTGGCSRR